MISLSVLAAITIKVSLIMGLALLATACLRRRSAAVRHWVLSVAIVCAAVVPLLQVVVPSWRLGSGASPAPPQVAATARTNSPVSTTSSSEVSVALQPPTSSAAQPERWNLGRIATSSRLLGQVWIVGALISLGMVLVGLTRLAWIASRSERIVTGRWKELADEIAAEYGLRRPVVLLQSEHRALLATWGLFQPKVLLPASAREWPEDRIRVVVAHELAHIRRGDWLVQMMADLLRSAYWFNPLVWIVCRRLRLESEHACDDAVLNRGVESLDYATHLLYVARTVATQHHTRLPAPAMARPSSLERRMSAMLNIGLDHNPVTRSARITTAIALLSITFLVAGYGVSAQTPSPTVSGTVHDQTGVAVPDVSVALTLSENSRPTTITVLTDASGYFEFDLGLPAGTYELEAEFPGFKTVEEQLTLEAGQSVERNLTLRIGSLQETIHVASSGRRGANADSIPPPPPPAPRQVDREKQSNESGFALAGGVITQPKRIKNADPVYPAGLAESGIGGRVELKARIDTSGAVTAIEVLTSPHPELANAAVEAVNQWQYTPTLLNGVPVEPQVDITVTFGAER